MSDQTPGPPLGPSLATGDDDGDTASTMDLTEDYELPSVPPRRLVRSGELPAPRVLFGLPTTPVPTTPEPTAPEPTAPEPTTVEPRSFFSNRLYRAVTDNDIDSVRRMISFDRGFVGRFSRQLGRRLEQFVCYQDEYGNTPLHKAIMNNSIDIANEIINLDVSCDFINIQNIAGYTPLHVAVSATDLSIHTEVIENITRKDTTKVQILNDDGETPLMLLLKRRSISSSILDRLSKPLMKGLTKHEIAENTIIRDFREHTLLNLIVSHDNPNILNSILSDVSGFDLSIYETEAERRNIEPLIHTSIRHNQKDMVYYLLEKGCDIHKQYRQPDSITRGRKNTPLTYAFEKDRFEIADKLLNEGASMYARDRDEDEPLFVLLKALEMDLNPNLKYIDLLIGHGYDFNRELVDGYVPLIYATIIGVNNFEVFEYILRNTDINVNNKIFELDGKRHTLLFFLVHIGSLFIDIPLDIAIRMIKILVTEKGVDIDDRNEDGHTLLMYILLKIDEYMCEDCKGFVKLIKTLVSLGSNVNQTNGDGNTPLHLVLFEILGIEEPALDVDDVKKIIRIFIENGADLTIRNGDGDTPQDYDEDELIPSVLDEIRTAGKRKISKRGGKNKKTKKNMRFKKTKKTKRKRTTTR